MKRPPLPLRLARRLAAPLRWIFGIHADPEIYGSASFMGEEELSRRFGRRNRGIVLSERVRFTLEDSFTNTAVLAPTGSGKSTRYVTPNLLQLEGSFLVTDPAGEIYARTSGWLASQGWSVHVLDTRSPFTSAQFNPLLHLDSVSERRKLAGSIVAYGQGARSDPFWSNMAGNLLTLAFEVLSRYPTRYNTLTNARWLLNHLAFSDTAREAAAMALSDSPPLLAELKAFLAQDDKMIDNILSSAREALILFGDPEVQQLTAGDTLPLHQLRRQKTVVYLIVPEDEIEEVGLLLNLFYRQVFRILIRQNPKSGDIPVFLFLDEFANMGKIHRFGAMATTLRKRKVSLNIILQSISQLEELYGKEDAETILDGGMGSKVFLHGLGLRAAQYLEKLLGTVTARDTLFGGLDEKARTAPRPLLSADEIRMLPRDEAIIVSGREKPLRIKMPYFFESEALVKRTRLDPVVPKVRQQAVEFIAFEPAQPDQDSDTA